MKHTIQMNLYIYGKRTCITMDYSTFVLSSLSQGVYISPEIGRNELKNIISESRVYFQRFFDDAAKVESVQNTIRFLGPGKFLKYNVLSFFLDSDETRKYFSKVINKLYEIGVEK